MKQHAILVVTSLLSILLLTLHITDDIVRGISKAESSNIALLILAVFLYGTLVLSGNDCLDPTHRELNSIRKLIAGVLWPISMNDKKRHLLLRPVLGLTFEVPVPLKLYPILDTFQSLS